MMASRASLRVAAAALALALALLGGRARAQLSQPIAVDANLDVTGNKFAARQPHNDGVAGDTDDEERPRSSGECPMNVQLRWMSELTSSVYSTPLIADLYADGAKEVVVPSFVHGVEVLEGADGVRSAGWPAYHKSTVHASALLHDIDGDGAQEVLVTTYDGEVLFYSQSGERKAHTLTVPRLRVRRNWFHGLDPDHVDHDHPDVQGALTPEELEMLSEDQADAEKPFDDPVAEEELPPYDGPPYFYDGEDQPTDEEDVEEVPVSKNADGSAREDAAAATAEEKLEEVPAKHEEEPSPVSDKETAEATQRRRLLQTPGVERPDDGGLTAEGEESFQVFEDDDMRVPYTEDAPPRPEGDINDGFYHDTRADYGDDHMWDDEEFFGPPHGSDEEYVYVDAHVLCTPTLADLDGDGDLELVVSVSYFYDREYYDHPMHAHELGEGVDIAKYIANGIVVFDLISLQVRWKVHLDLSTDHTQYRAYVYSSPTVADINGDGKLEVIVGTSVGFLYALNHDGSPRDGFPVQMGEIQGQVAVADLDEDGNLDMVACDTRGNVAAFSWRGSEIWERHVGSIVAQGVTFGDVNGDGHLEVVVVTASGTIHIMDAKTGQEVSHFRTHGRVMAPALITQLTPLPQMHIIVISFDGFLYLVDGKTGCVDVVDVGETSYSMPLADDLTGNGRLDIVVATMNGNVYCFETPAPADPLATWPSQVQAHNGFVARRGWLGIAATPATRAFRDVGGARIDVQFDIVDKRAAAQSGRAVDSGTAAPAVHRYDVELHIQTANPGKWVPVQTVSRTFTSPGTYTITLPTPRTRTHGMVVLKMRNELGLTFQDSFGLAFHVHFYRVLKWLLTAPFFLMGLVFLLADTARRGGVELPTFARGSLKARDD